MKNYRLHILGFIAALLLVTAACGFSVSTAKISDAFTARDNNGAQERTTVFAQDEVFYANVALANAPDDTVVKAVWYVVAAEGLDPNTKLYESDEFIGGDKVSFSMFSEIPWPVGSYKVEIYLNDKLDRTLEFSVQ